MTIKGQTVDGIQPYKYGTFIDSNLTFAANCLSWICVCKEQILTNSVYLLNGLIDWLLSHSWTHHPCFDFTWQLGSSPKVHNNKA